MGYLQRLLAAEDPPRIPSPIDDFWYQPFGYGLSAAGQSVTPETAQKVSAFFAGVRLLANDVAKLPLELYERQAGGDKTRVPDVPLYDVLHRRPNAWQTSFEWRRQGMRHLILRGNWYNLIRPGPRGPVDQLVPLNPDLVAPVQLDTLRVAYRVRDPKTYEVRIFTQDEIFHVRGVSDDGVVGKSVLAWARDSVGVALATESYAGRLFSQGALHGGVITVPGVLTDEASTRLAKSFATTQQTWHLPRVLEQGATYAESDLTPEDSQFLKSREFSVTEMARWLGLPPHKLADLLRSTNNNIEHQALEYVIDSLSPWLILIEQTIGRDVIIEPARYFAEFNIDALLRGDSQARGDFHSKLFNIGAVSQNDVRRRENMNTIPGGDTYYVPANLRPSDAPWTAPLPAAGPSREAAPVPPRRSRSPQPPRDEEEEGEEIEARSRAEGLLAATLSRLLRRETKVIQKCAVRHADNSEAFIEHVAAFYAAHVALVGETLAIDRAAASRYCAGQASQLVAAVEANGWIAVIERWQAPAYAKGLALLILDHEL